jgi:hypothetical protein
MGLDCLTDRQSQCDFDFDLTRRANLELTDILSSLCSLEADSTESASIAFTVVAYCCTHYLATGSLPRISLRWYVFIEPLPSSGSVHHSMFFRNVGAVLPDGVMAQYTTETPQFGVTVSVHLNTLFI